MVISLPKHVNINRLEMMPVNQSFAPFQVHRDKNKIRDGKDCDSK